jgi:hypothetical protein
MFDGKRVSVVTELLVLQPETGLGFLSDIPCLVPDQSFFLPQKLSIVL